MPPSDNKALVRRFYEAAWGRGELDVIFSGVNIFRFDGGKIAEIWNHHDDLGLAEQLGVPVFAGAAPEV